MRLIDADRIKQSVMNEMLKAELSSPVYYTLECVIADIDNQPTAYDADKIVEHLKKRKKYILTDFILANKAYEVKERTMARINEIDGLIEIVRISAVIPTGEGIFLSDTYSAGRIQRAAGKGVCGVLAPGQGG